MELVVDFSVSFSVSMILTRDTGKYMYSYWQLPDWLTYIQS